jgi:hypothetical protein
MQVKERDLGPPPWGPDELISSEQWSARYTLHKGGTWTTDSLKEEDRAYAHALFIEQRRCHYHGDKEFCFCEDNV